MLTAKPDLAVADLMQPGVLTRCAALRVRQVEPVLICAPGCVCLRLMRSAMPACADYTITPHLSAANRFGQRLKRKCSGMADNAARSSSILDLTAISSSPRRHLASRLSGVSAKTVRRHAFLRRVVIRPFSLI